MLRIVTLSSCCALALALPGCGSPDPVTPPDCDADPLLPGCTDARPAYEGTSAEIEILRDADGVPHLYAATDADAFYASGYMQAFDRLFQMDMTRRQALGRRAEVLGAGAIGDDRIVRIMDIPRWGRTNEAELFRRSPEEWRLFQAWTAGVNARIQEVLDGDAPMPPEFADLGYEPELWDVSDGFSVGKLLVFGNANQLEYDILSTVITQYLPDLDPRALLTPIREAYVMPPDERPGAGSSSLIGALPPPAHLPPLPLPDGARDRILRLAPSLDAIRSGGSNNWVIDGRHTATGRPLLAGDPHQPLNSPSLFWTHHLSGDALDVVGFSFVGTSSVQLGHNARIAWGATTNYPDAMDLWSVVPGPTGGVMIAGAEVRPRVRHETITVAGSGAVEMDVEDVPGRGLLLPVEFLEELGLPMLGRPGTRVLIDWTGFRPTHEPQGFHGFGLAQTIDEFDAAQDRMEVAFFNFVAADANGITYRSNALVPDRGTPDGTLRPFALLDGNDPDTYWTSFLPIDRMPHSRGGARGWVASANNDPWGFSSDGDIAGDPWYFGVYFDPGFRAARIETEITRLVARGDVTIEEMQILQDDTYSILAEDMVPELVEAWATVDTDPALERFRDLPELDALVAALGAWDYRMERSSSEAVVFNAFGFFFARRVLRDELSLVFDPIMQSSPAFILKLAANVLHDRVPDSAAYFTGEPRAVALAAALEETAAYLMAQFGSTSTGYTWGAIHGTRFPSIHGDRLDGGWVPTDGAEGTVNVSVTRFFDGEGMPRERLESSSGSIFRMVASFRDDGTPEAFVNVPRGISGDPESPHWDDLHDDWIENRYRRLRFLRTEVEADPTERMTIGAGAL